jgi:hypothetical protein
MNPSLCGIDTNHHREGVRLIDMLGAHRVVNYTRRRLSIFDG